LIFKLSQPNSQIMYFLSSLHHMEFLVKIGRLHHIAAIGTISRKLKFGMKIFVDF